jgi:uncharacterized ferritin-like protein (DUF455 family)
MRRFISHEELARDKRFIRAQNTTVGAEGLPDDVDTLVAIFEKMAPEIERRIQGTKLEEIYDQAGPGFQILSQLGRLGADAESSKVQMASRMHGILVGEMQALEAAGRTTWDFPELEWGFKMNMARQCWDEARHVQIYEKLLHHYDGEVGDYPENTFLFETGCADDPVLRVTGVNRCIEGLACDVFRDLVETGKRTGDKILEQAVDYVLADELTHVRFGSDWSKECTKDDPERRERTKEFQKETERNFAFGGRRKIAHQDRREAGFSEEELEELEHIFQDVRENGPSTETLITAAELMRERHHARKRGEAVAPIEVPAAN